MGENALERSGTFRFQKFEVIPISFFLWGNVIAINIIDNHALVLF
jgi:hypothetical protein